MSSRARVFATVTLISSCLSGPAAWGQATNLEAGKSASQLFAGTCNACHKSPRGLLKTVSRDALSDFLREHYTTSGDMASQLATYLISNGASEKPKQSADKPGADKQGQGGSSDQADRQGRKNRNAPAQEAARPDDAPPAGEGGRQGRRRQARPGETPDESRPIANAPAQSDTERSPDGRKLSTKQRGKPAKPPAADEPSMANEPPKMEPAKEDSAADRAKAEPRQEVGNSGGKPDADIKSGEAAKSEPARSEPAKSEAAKVDAPKDGVSVDKPAPRREAAPAVTLAPAAAMSAPSAASAPMAAPAVTSGASMEPAAPRASAPASTPSPAVTASTPSPRPPAPPISQ